MIMRDLVFHLLLLALGVVALANVARASWRRPERLDSTWTWKRAAPALAAAPLGPSLPVLRDAIADRYWMEGLEQSGARARDAWRATAGATEDWSPMAEAAAAERAMLPLDDVDEWLAGRLSAFDHALMEIGAATRGADGSPRPIGWTVEEELDAFQRGSMGLQAYRDMILKSSREFTPRESMELEQLLASA